jgi:diamine N-acetyltransferase
MTVTLKEITRNNWYEATKLRVHENQEKYVAPNLYSIAQSKFYPTWVPLAIYNGDGAMVGFVMYGVEDGDKEGDYWIIRLMIDKNHQGQGYGRAAMQAVLERIKALPTVKNIFVSYVPVNEVAEKLYASLGFEKTGTIEDGEEVVQLKVGKP